MKVAVIGSRSITKLNLADYLPPETSELVSGGAKGVDSIAETYAKQQQLPVTLFLPNYQKYSRAAPLKRNVEIVSYADFVLAFWDGHSKGTKHVIALCHRQQKPFRVVFIK